MKEPMNLSTLSGGAIANREQAILDRAHGNGASAGPSLSYTDERAGEQGPRFLDYWRIIRKHIWLILGISVLIPTLVAIVVIRKPDVYESQARIQVDLENANPLLGGMSKSS